MPLMYDWHDTRMEKNMKRFLALAAAVFLLGVPGCGPVTAKYTVDDVALAQVPIQEKQPVFAAEQEVAVAKSEKNALTSDIENTKREIDLADLERQQRGLSIQTAKVELDGAQKSHDLNAQSAATEK